MPTGSSYHVRALERALDVLETFSIDEPSFTLDDLTARTGLAKSTIFRLLSTLQARGYVEQLSETERYRVGIRAFELGSVYIQTMKLEAEAQPILKRLVDECGQTANLGVLDGNEIVHLAVVPPDRPIRFHDVAGGREQAHCSGLGKVLLADLDDSALDDIFRQHELEMRTARTIISVDQLRSHLGVVREQGYALDDEESYVGLRCIAAAVLDDRGRAVAAVSISGPAAEFTEPTFSRYVDAVMRAAREISLRLGSGVQMGRQAMTPVSDSDGRKT